MAKSVPQAWGRPDINPFSRHRRLPPCLGLPVPPRWEAADSIDLIVNGFTEHLPSQEGQKLFLRP